MASNFGQKAKKDVKTDKAITGTPSLPSRILKYLFIRHSHCFSFLAFITISWSIFLLSYFQDQTLPPPPSLYTLLTLLSQKNISQYGPPEKIKILRIWIDIELLNIANSVHSPQPHLESLLQELVAAVLERLQLVGGLDHVDARLLLHPTIHSTWQLQNCLSSRRMVKYYNSTLAGQTRGLLSH